MVDAKGTREGRRSATLGCVANGPSHRNNRRRHEVFTPRTAVAEARNSGRDGETRRPTARCDATKCLVDIAESKARGSSCASEMIARATARPAARGLVPAPLLAPCRSGLAYPGLGASRDGCHDVPFRTAPAFRLNHSIRGGRPPWMLVASGISAFARRWPHMLGIFGLVMLLVVGFGLIRVLSIPSIYRAPSCGPAGSIGFPRLQIANAAPLQPRTRNAQPLSFLTGGVQWVPSKGWAFRRLAS